MTNAQMTAPELAAQDETFFEPEERPGLEVREGLGPSEEFEASAGEGAPSNAAGEVKPAGGRGKAGEGASSDEAPREPVENLTGLLEAILFLSRNTVRYKDVCKRFDVTAGDFELAMESLKEKYSGGGLEIVEIAGGFELATRPEFSEQLRLHFNQGQSGKLTRAALETLSIVAYKQPITRAEIEGLRGVASGHLIHTLIDRNLVKVVGRAPGLGRPLLYATTDEFLRYLGLKSIEDLPPLEAFIKES